MVAAGKKETRVRCDVKRIFFEPEERFIHGDDYNMRLGRGKDARGHKKTLFLGGLML